MTLLASCARRAQSESHRQRIHFAGQFMSGREFTPELRRRVRRHLEYVLLGRQESEPAPTLQP